MFAMAGIKSTVVNPVNVFYRYLVICGTEHTSARQSRPRSQETQEADKERHVNKNPNTHDSTREAMDQREDRDQWSELMDSYPQQTAGPSGRHAAEDNTGAKEVQ